MVIILFALFVAALLVLEFFLLRAKQREEETAQPVPLKLETVEGVKLSRQLSFYPLHTWARRTDTQTAVVGIDDLARRLIGTADKVVLPLEGADVEAGQSCVRISNGKRITSVVSPVSGEVVEINNSLSKKPGLLYEDPYGDGWLFRVRSWRLPEQFRSLLSGELASDWMRAAVQRLRFGLGSAAGAVAQDGGQLRENLSEQLDRHDWIRLVHETLGTESMEEK